MDTAEALRKAAQHWSATVNTVRPSRGRWWQSPTICSHLNRTICGELVPGLGAGNVAALRRRFPGRVFGRGISVGAGGAPLETMLVQAGIVERFDLYEIAQARIEQGRIQAAAQGLADRLVYYNANAFTSASPGTYDLVNWFDSLHHMFDVVESLAWSRTVLAENGVLLLDEFVGPTHMQYTDRQLDLAAAARACLPKRYLANPSWPDELLPLRESRPDIEAMKQVDPTECADSGRILPALQLIFPDAEIIPTGGVIYHLALSDVLANIHEKGDAALLNSLLLADDLCIALGQSLRAFAIALKPAE
jgi:hypothetical protein